MGQIRIISSSPEIREFFFLNHLKDLHRQLKIEGTITIKLGGKPESKRLNSTYLNRNYATDVLSFPLNQQFPDAYYLGDIFICLPVARKQARENRVPLEDELLRLMIHGILHLSGFNHENDDGEMLRLQERLLDNLLKTKQAHE